VYANNSEGRATGGVDRQRGALLFFWLSFDAARTALGERTNN